jgi:CAAX prenyl protease-like protein
MAVFLLLTTAEGWLPRSAPGRDTPDPDWYVSFYALKVVAVAIAMILGRSSWRDLRPRPSAAVLAVAVVLGLIVTAAWVGLERLPYPRIDLGGSRQAFNPAAIESAGIRTAFVSLRLAGLVLLVPLFEELFWRSFLLRWIIDQDFWKVPIGHVTLPAAAITSALFAAAHPEWLPALLTGLAWAGLLAWSRSLTACVVSHATANLALGIYVLTTGHWELW